MENYTITRYELIELHDMTNLCYYESCEDMQKALEEIQEYLETKFNFLDPNQ